MSSSSSSSSSRKQAEQPDLSTTLAGLHLTSCLYNASGPRCGTAAALAKVAASSATGAVLSKSATLKAQTGNPQPRTFHAENDVASFNSEGLPNNGIDYYIAAETVREIFALATSSDNDNKPNDTCRKPYIVSLSGKTLADNLQMLQAVADANRRNTTITTATTATTATTPTTTTTSKNQTIAAIELNLACPNIIGKPIIAYDVPQMRDILQKVKALILKNNNKNNNTTMPPLGIKLAPYLDFVQLGQVAALINEYKDVVRYIVTINTVGNALCLDMHAQQPVIGSNKGFAGLSGPAVHYTALANVRQFRNLLDESIDIVGVGGVQTGQQAAALLLAGATAVQVGTTHWKQGPACFARIATELKAYMQSHGMTNIEQVRQSFHLWTPEGAALSRKAKSKQKDATNNDNNNNLFVMLSAILAAIVAILVADKFGVVELP